MSLNLPKVTSRFNSRDQSESHTSRTLPKHDVNQSVETIESQEQSSTQIQKRLNLSIDYNSKLRVKVTTDSKNMNYSSLEQARLYLKGVIDNSKQMTKDAKTREVQNLQLQITQRDISQAPIKIEQISKCSYNMPKIKVFSNETTFQNMKSILMDVKGGEKIKGKSVQRRQGSLTAVPSVVGDIGKVTYEQRLKIIEDIKQKDIEKSILQFKTLKDINQTLLKVQKYKDLSSD